jgi:SdrD B-like domain
MSTWKRAFTSSDEHGFGRRKLRPFVEMIERRALMTGGFGFIAGTAFIDQAKSGLLDPTDAYLPGATIQLFQAGTASPIATTSTDANGAYLFNNLAPGTYTVTETPPTGFQPTAAQALSNVEPGTVTSANSIRVVVPNTDLLILNYSGVLANEFQTLLAEVDGTMEQDAVGPLHASLGTSPGATDISGDFITFCVDDLARVSFGGGEDFPVVTEPITSLSNGGTTISAEHAGRIAFLYNHFGSGTLSNIQGPALQLAIWELLYDSSDTPDFSAGNFDDQGPLAPTTQTTLDQVLAQAAAYYNASAGKSEAAVLLQTTGNTDSPHQSMLGTASFNFGNDPVGDQNLTHSAISGFVYCDDNKDSKFDSGDMPLSAVTMTLTGTDQTGAAVHLTTTTDSTGAYHFLNLVPGTYTITETQPANFLPGAITQGTPGTGTVVPNAIAQITLAGGVNGQNNDFGEILQPVAMNNVTLFGIHQQVSNIVLKLSGPVNAVNASNPASYTLLSLGKDDKLGTADDQRVVILSAVYNSLTHEVTLTPATHLNIHYHYLLETSIAGTACSSGVVATSILGRANMVVWDWHGTEIAPPKMTRKEILHNTQVVSRSLAYLKLHPKVASTVHKTAAANKAIQHGKSPISNGHH